MNRAATSLTRPQSHSPAAAGFLFDTNPLPVSSHEGTGSCRESSAWTSKRVPSKDKIRVAYRLSRRRLRVQWASLKLV